MKHFLRIPALFILFLLLQGCDKSNDWELVIPYEGAFLLEANADQTLLAVGDMRETLIVLKDLKDDAIAVRAIEAPEDVFQLCFTDNISIVTYAGELFNYDVETDTWSLMFSEGVKSCLAASHTLIVQRDEEIILVNGQEETVISGLPDRVTDAQYEPDGTLLVLAANGMLFRITASQPVPYKELPVSGVIEMYITSNHSEIWLLESANRMIHRVNLDSMQVEETYSIDRGFLNQVSGDSLGNVWIPTTYQILQFNVSSREIEEVEYPIGITELDGVVFIGDRLYIATEKGVYQRDLVLNGE